LENQANFYRHEPFYWHLYRSIPIVAIRDGKYSLVAYRDNKELPTTNLLEEKWIPMIKGGGYKDYQMFDLIEDPNQTRDISAHFPNKFIELKRKLLEINKSVMDDGYDWHLEN
jgi:arylsulfatase A